MTRCSVSQGHVHDERADILAVLQRNLSGHSARRYAWNYHECPYGKAYCWIARREDSRDAVGTAAVFPRVFYVLGKPVRAGLAGDFAVDQPCRAYGPAVLMQKRIQGLCESGNLQFIYGIPNEFSERLFLSVGYVCAGTYKRFFKVLKTEYKHGTYLPGRSFAPSISRVIDRCIHVASRESWHRKTAWQSQVCSGFDERFEPLFRHARCHNPVSGERSVRFLTWRFSPCDVSYRVFCLTNAQSEILGYMVYHLQDGMCVVSDMLFKGEKRLFKALMSHFLCHIRAAGAGSVVLCHLGAPKTERWLAQFNYFVVGRKRLLVYCKDPDTAKVLSRAENWDFFTADNDI